MGAENESPLTAEDVQEQMLECRLELNARLEQGDATMEELSAGLAKAITMLSELETAMGVILEIYAAGEGFVKVTIVIAKVLKFFAAVSLACGVIWAALHFGGTPK